MTGSAMAGDMVTGPTWRLIATGATLRHVWRIPLLVGTLLTLVNQGPRMTDGFEPSLYVAVAVNYLTPYVVSSLGFLSARRSDGGLGSPRTQRYR